MYNDNNETHSLTIKDNLAILVWGGFSLLLLVEAFTKGTFACFLGFCFCALRTKVIFKGFEIDVENDELRFPGGGISFNDITETFKNLNQFFKRHTLPLSEIQSINTKVDYRFNSNGKGIKNYYVILNGSFGSIKVKLYSEGKMEQLFTVLVQVNDMGTPIIKR